MQIVSYGDLLRETSNPVFLEKKKKKKKEMKNVNLSPAVFSQRVV